MEAVQGTMVDGLSKRQRGYGVVDARAEDELRTERTTRIEADVIVSEDE